MAERREKLLGDVGGRDARRDVHTVIFVADKRDTDDKDTEKKILRFTAWLKEERNCWAILVEEMRAGMFILSFLLQTKETQTTKTQKRRFYASQRG